METIPRNCCPSTTGKWRIRRCVISANAVRISVSGDAVIAKAIDDVTLGNDADDAPVLDYGKRANSLCSQTLDRIEQSGVRRDRFDAAALIAKH